MPCHLIHHAGQHTQRRHNPQSCLTTGTVIHTQARENDSLSLKAAQTQLPTPTNWGLAWVASRIISCWINHEAGRLSMQHASSTNTHTDGNIQKQHAGGNKAFIARLLQTIMVACCWQLTSHKHAAGNLACNRKGASDITSPPDTPELPSMQKW